MREKKIEKAEKDLREKIEVWEKSVPSNNVIQKEEKFENKIEKILLSEQPSGLLLCKGTIACTATLSKVCELPPQVQNFLKDFGDIFPKEGPIALPPVRGIEHQIDLVSGASIPSRSAYRTNPKETKEIVTSSGIVGERLGSKSPSPSVVPVLLVPKKDGKWRMCCDCRAINNITIK